MPSHPKWKLPKQRYFCSTEISQKNPHSWSFFLMIPSPKGNPNPIAPLSLKITQSLTFSPGHLLRFSRLQAFKTSKFSTWLKLIGSASRERTKAVQGMSGESLRLCGALAGQLEGRDLRSWKVWWQERMNTAKKNKAFFCCCFSFKVHKNFSCAIWQGEISTICRSITFMGKADFELKCKCWDSWTFRRSTFSKGYLSCFVFVSLILLGAPKNPHSWHEIQSQVCFWRKYEQPISSRSVSHMTLHKGVGEKTMVSLFWITQDAGSWQMKI